MKVSGEGSFTIHPDGQHQGVLVDVIDLGMQSGPYGTKRRMRLMFETEATREDDPTVNLTIGISFNATITEGSNLRNFLQTWRGRPFVKEELREFDLESLIGVNALLTVVHEDKGDKTRAIIAGAVKLHRSISPMEPSGKYVRVKDRSAEDQKKFFERFSNDGPNYKQSGNGAGRHTIHAPDDTELSPALTTEDDLPF